MEQPATLTFSSELLHRQALAILRGWRLAEEDAVTTADVLIDCDLRGVDTHGISLLALYAIWMKGGNLDFSARPEIEREGPGFAVVDGGNGLGFAVSVLATRLAVAKARVNGVGAVSVRRSRHFGAAGYYARLAAREGMISLVTTSTKVVCVVPPGAAEPVLGTNPLAYGVPTASGEPIVFDMATSTAAGNKVRLAHLRDKPLPEGWVIDGAGAPVTDPHEAYRLVYEADEGGLTPLGADPLLGSHKGYGLALLAHFLGGALAGEAFAGARKQDGIDNVGHFFLAVDPSVFRGLDDFLGDVDEVGRTLRGARPIDPARPVLLPGDIESRTYAERRRRGVPMPIGLVDQLQGLAESLGVAFYLDRRSAGTQ